MSAGQPSASSTRFGGPLPISERQRLQRIFERAQNLSLAGRVAEANEAYFHCATCDPGCLVYVQSFLNNLAHFSSPSLVARIHATFSRRAFHRAVRDRDWKTAFQRGLAILTREPQDLGTLRRLAEICAECEFDEVELLYLRFASACHPRDVALLEHLATALAHQGRFSESTETWQRVTELSPSNTRAREMLAELCTPIDSHATALDGHIKAVNEDPTRAELAIELAGQFQRRGDFDQALITLKSALNASPGNADLWTAMEATQIAQAQKYAQIAERLANRMATPRTRRAAEQWRADLNRLELEIYAARSQRRPEDLESRFQLAVRLRVSGNYRAAVEEFSRIAQSGGDRQVDATIQRGECRQFLRQFDAALADYQIAMEMSRKADPNELWKRAVYRAGVLADSMNDSRGRQWLGELVDLDPDYRDAKARLDKTGDMRHKD